MNSPDSGLLRHPPDSLIDALQTAGAGSPISAEVDDLLVRIGWLTDGVLTNEGRRVHKLAHVLGDQEAAQAELAGAMQALLPVRVILQELAGFGAVPETGVLELLRVHNAIPEGVDADALRPLLRWLSARSLVAYSRRDKTVRVTSIEPTDEEPATPSSGVVSPRTPFTNIVNLRRILRRVSGDIFWADPYLDRRVLEELLTCIDVSAVRSVRLLSSNKKSVATDEAKGDWILFEKELLTKSVNSYWNYDPSRDWHDRWLFDNDGGYNMPPSALIFQGTKYSEFSAEAERPPFEDWWSRSRPLF